MCELNAGQCAGYERHRRRGEIPCDECRQAKNRYSADRSRQMRAGTWTRYTPSYTSAPSVLLDHLETFGSMTTPILVLQLEDRFTKGNVRRSLYRLRDRGEVTRRDDWEGNSLWAVA